MAIWTYVVAHASNSAMANYNWTLCSSPEQIFRSCEPICEIHENLHLRKITHYTVNQIRTHTDVCTETILRNQVGAGLPLECAWLKTVKIIKELKRTKEHNQMKFKDCLYCFVGHSNVFYLFQDSLHYNLPSLMNQTHLNTIVSLHYK